MITLLLLTAAMIFTSPQNDGDPQLREDNVKEMAENQEIGSVTIDSTQITFTNKDDSEYFKTGIMDDPQLVDRLYESGAEFKQEIVTTTSPIAYILVSYVLPVVLMVVLFRLLTKKMGGKSGNSMMFGIGKFSSY